ncbi:MAG TPA: FAD-dependent oxidoreductase, partial [Tepidisphaeraceae bacterium]|nr:FAD-dependent oxidoreductase [Tepidisphaeraceae bacterium]
ANGAWGIDLHFPGGILLGEEKPFVPPHGGAFEKLGTLPYGIGLKSLYSRNVENMFAVGRNMSSSYIAFCSSRVLSTGCVVGQAAGVAAGVCKKYGVLPRGVVKEHMKECQQLILRQDGNVPGVENEDPNDLARSATASASSEMVFGMGEPVTAHEMAIPRAQLFPVSGDRIETVSVYLQSKLDHDVEMKMTLRAAGQVWDFRSREDMGEAKAVVKAGSDGWVEFKLGANVKPRGLYWVWLGGMAGVYWKAIAVPRGESHATPPGCVAAQKMGKTRWEQLGTGLCMGLKVTPESKAYGAGNVNTGTHRPDRWTNIWMSDNELPAWVELKWEEKKKLNTVVLAFDTNTGRREDLPYFRYPDCVKDYDVEAMVGGEWKVVAGGRGNYLRRCEHRFERMEAEAVRVKVLATNGAKMARVYEVRVYDV